MNRSYTLFSSLLLTLLFMCGIATAQSSSFETEVIKSGIPSPKKEMKGKIGDASINVVYGSPSVKGRNVWTDLAPYGKIWRTGANEATTIEFSSDMKFEGKSIAKGKYSLFTIPGKDKWTIILNSKADQWGAYRYKDDKDVLRVEVSPISSNDNNETMEFALEGDKLVLMWEKVKVPIKVGI